MLGAGIGVNKYKSKNSFIGILDSLGIVSNTVYAFSPQKRLTGTYTGNKLLLKRLSDNATDYIHTSDYDSGGNINSAEIATWSQGNDVIVDKEYSEVEGAIAYQNTDAYKPKIVESGNFLSDGLKFDGSDDFMKIDKYSALNITTPPLTTYMNLKPVLSSGYLFCINYNDSNTIQYSLAMLTNNYTASFNELTTDVQITILNAVNKCICSWQGTGANELKLKNESTETLETLNATLNARDYVHIGCRSNSNDGLTVSSYGSFELKTLIVFDSDEYGKYLDLVNAGV